MTKQLTLLLLAAVFLRHSYAAGQSTQHDCVQPESQGSASATKPKPEKVYHIGGGVTIPRVIQSSQPQLDEQQVKQMNVGKKVKTGSTMLKIIVGEDGTVRNATVLESFDHDLDAKAIEVVKQWKFEPATKKGVPVAVELGVKVDFRLYK
jgi:TonB family protein